MMNKQNEFTNTSMDTCTDVILMNRIHPTQIAVATTLNDVNTVYLIIRYANPVSKTKSICTKIINEIQIARNW